MTGNQRGVVNSFFSQITPATFSLNILFFPLCVCVCVCLCVCEIDIYILPGFNVAS